MIHESLELPLDCEEHACVRGSYKYYHYNCDGLDDRGWGCGYRTLQTLCSWVFSQHVKQGRSVAEVPGLPQVQTALVAMSDKPSSFKDSREWIGSVEVGLCLDYFYDVSCKILHIPSGSELMKHTDEIMMHFREKGSPLMMGGDGDASSKGIMGIARSKSSYSLLVLDPHYVGPSPDGHILKQEKMLLWRPLESFMADSFYNICMPQLVAC